MSMRAAQENMVMDENGKLRYVAIHEDAKQRRKDVSLLLRAMGTLELLEEIRDTVSFYADAQNRIAIQRLDGGIRSDLDIDQGRYARELLEKIDLLVD